VRGYKYLLLLVVVLVFVFVSLPGEDLEVVFCDVGQGDAVLISKGYSQVLIDAGPDDSVLGCLEEHIPFWDRRIEMVVNTHADRDHIGGLDEVLSSYMVGRLVISEYGDNRDSMRVEELVERDNIPVWEAVDGGRLVLGDIEFEVLWPGRDSKGQVLGVSDKRNEVSVVLKMSYGEFDVALVGDIGFVVEEEIYDDFGDVEVLKVGHHGSKHSSSSEFLDAVKPELSVIQVGKNSYGHPSPEVIERLEKVGSRVMRNDKDGDVVVWSNGVDWGVYR
jgi:competence protein ComEC